ncbi:MAG: ATP-binding protein [Deltaproteobacteria bacterium]|nr:ATP-binding protein [Deltaproteobacteria bacterium]
MATLSKRSSYFYAGLFLLAVLIILVGNSLYLIYKTDSNLIDIYWKQGELVEETMAIGARQSIESVTLTPRKLKRFCKKTASLIDELDFNSGGKGRNEIMEILKENSFDAVAFFDQNKNFITGFSKQKLPDFHKINLTEDQERNVTIFNPLRDPDEKEVPLLSEQSESKFISKAVTLTFERLKVPGWISITIGPERLQEIQYQIGLQIFIASLENRNLLEYITFYNSHFEIIADSDPKNIGITEKRPEFIESLQSKVSYFFINNEVMEIIHPWGFNREPKGVFKIGFPTTEIDRIYYDTLRNTILISVAVMLMAMMGVSVVLRWQINNSQKFMTMRRKILENEKLVSLANLTAGVAHEVRNPLNSIGITIQRLQYEYQPQDDEDAKEYLSLTGLMKKEVARINQIISDFLGFAKPFEPKSAYFSIDDFLNESITLFLSEANEKGVMVLKNFRPHDKEFYGDREKLIQVFLNLLKNALDATSTNGEIGVASVLKKDGTWVLSVIDNGEGIDKKQLNHIFDIYFTTKENGTGLGLYISRKIINAHFGSIELIPNPNRGVTARLTLPKVDH